MAKSFALATATGISRYCLAVASCQSFTRPPDFLSQDELRYWIREFLYNPAFGWSHCKCAFARCLGIDLHGLKSKIRQGRTQARFCGGEQLRFSRRIRRLLAGELVPKHMRARSGQMKWEAVLADDPQPMRREEVARPRIDLATGYLRLRWEVVPKYSPPSPRTLLERAQPFPTRDEHPLTLCRTFA